MPDYELFMATDEVARAGGDAVPLAANYLAPDSDRFPFCDEVMLCILWGFVSGNGYDSAMHEAFDRVHESSEDGPWVERVPSEFVEQLCSLSPAKIGPIAVAWSETEEFRVMLPDPREPAFAGVGRFFGVDRHAERVRSVEDERRKTARAHLESLIRLAERARQESKGIYLWRSL